MLHEWSLRLLGLYNNETNYYYYYVTMLMRVTVSACCTVTLGRILSILAMTALVVHQMLSLG